MSQSRLTSALVPIFALALLVGAPTLALLLGLSAQNFENRPTHSAPSFDLTQLVDPEFYSALDLYIEDRNPLRWYAVAALSRARYSLFGTVYQPPTSGPQIALAGREGWLFLEEGFRQKCWDAEPLLQGVKGLANLQESVVARGKVFLFTVAPNKETVYSEFVTPGSAKLAECARKSLSLLTGMLESEHINYVDALKVLTDAKAIDTRPLYSKLDTHWSDVGSAYFISQIVRSIPGAPAPPTELAYLGSKAQLPDLSRLSGLFYEEERPSFRHKREGQQVRATQAISHDDPGRPYVRQTSHSTGAPLDRRKVLVLHDSFFYVSWDHLASFFDDVLYVHWTAFQPDMFERQIMDADIVIVESVEREVFNRLVTLSQPTPWNGKQAARAK